jgi:hypothetical protein
VESQSTLEDGTHPLAANFSDVTDIGSWYLGVAGTPATPATPATYARTTFIEPLALTASPADVLAAAKYTVANDSTSDSVYYISK